MVETAKTPLKNCLSCFTIFEMDRNRSAVYSTNEMLIWIPWKGTNRRYLWKWNKTTKTLYNGYHASFVSPNNLCSRLETPSEGKYEER